MKDGEIMNERIKQLRKALGLNQTEFGNRIGVKQSTITGYETGSREPLETVLNSICREFNVNESWLRTGEGNMFVELPINNVVATTARFLGKKDPTFEAIVQLYAEMSPEDREAMMKFGFYLKDKFGNHGSDEDSK